MEVMISFISAIRNGLTIAALLWMAYLLHLLWDRIHLAYMGPLSKIPGPKLYFISRGFFQARQLTGERWKWLRDHIVGHYGSIFRLGPIDVLITDKRLIKQIIEMDLPKSVNYERFRQIREIETLFSATDRVFHKQRRRIISPAFSIKNLNSLEPLVAGCLREVVIKIDEICERNDTDNLFDLYTYMGYLLLDITGETAFGGSFGFVRTGFHPVPQKVRSSLKYMVLRNMFPILTPFMRTDPSLFDFTKGIIKKRQQQLEAPSRNDILQILLNAASEGAMTDIEIHQQILEFLIAGTDSTAFTTTVCMIYLAKHPDTMRKLVQELDEALGPIDNSHVDASVVMHEQIKTLPYLNAVINEAMRIWPVSLDGGTARRTTEEMTVGGYFIPKDTTLVLCTYPLHLDPNEWGENAKDFVPERWLEPEKLPKDCYYPFMTGPRNCIGQNLALMEIRIVLATLLRRYSWEEALGQEFDVVMFIAPALKSGSYKLRVRKREFAAA